MSAPKDVSTTVVKDASLEARSVNVEGAARVELETQTHAVGTINPPPDIRAIVDKTAQFVARNGPEFETRILGSEKNNAKFNFLLPADPYNAYYKSKIAAFKEEASGGNAAAVAKKAEEAAKAANAASGTVTVAAAGSAVAKVLVAPKKEVFTVNAPDGAASRDLDVIKLTAQFAAKHGEGFIIGIAKKEHANPEFAFLKPTHSMRGVFDALADAYAKVLRPPKNVDALLQKDEDKSAVLERALQRLEWERSQDLAKKAADDEAEKEREAFALIDWHDFTVVETVDFEDEEDDDLPEPMTLRDIVAQLRDVEAPSSADAAPGQPSASAPGSDARAGGDVEMDQEEKAMIDAGAAAAATAGPPGPAPGMKIVRDHKKPEVLAAEAKARAAARAGADATTFAVSPITGELVAVDDMAEHMRVSLIDPKWKTQKEAMLAKLKGSTTANDDEVAANVLALARTRPDIFGTTDEEVSNAVAESIEARKQGPAPRGGGLPPQPEPTGPSLRAGLAKAPPQPPPAKAAPAMPPPPPPAPAPVMPPPPPPAPGPALKAAPTAAPPVAPPPVAPAPAPTKEAEAEESKKRKIGETELLEESDFLAANPGGGVVHVRCPSVDGDEHMNGQTLDLAVDAFDLPLSEFKKLVKDALGGLAANKQKISAAGLGFLTDKKTLAFYNLAGGSEVTLTLKERGGRKK